MDQHAGPRTLRYLKWIGIVAPALFLLALEAVHASILAPAFGAEVSNLLASGLAVVAAAGFGLVLFFNIEATQRETVRQNRDMGVVTAVSLAVQGELAVDHVMQAALLAIAQRTRASHVAIHVPASEPGHHVDRRQVYDDPNRVARDGLSVPTVGQPAPDFKTTTDLGKAVQLSSFIGSPVWLTFGASWCQPCRSENPDIQAAWDKYKDKGLVLVQVFHTEEQATVTRYADTVGITYTRIPDPDSRLAGAYRIMGIPTHFFIDKTGVLHQITSSTLDPAAIDAALKEIMG